MIFSKDIEELRVYNNVNLSIENQLKLGWIICRFENIETLKAFINDCENDKKFYFCFDKTDSPIYAIYINDIEQHHCDISISFDKPFRTYNHISEIRKEKINNILS